MPVRACSYNFHVHYPEEANLLPSHRLMSRIIDHFSRIPVEQHQLTYYTLVYFCKILIQALDVNTGTIDVTVFYEYYTDDGEPVNLDYEVEVLPKDPKWSDGIQSVEVCCDLGINRQIHISSKRAHPLERRGMQFPRHVRADYRGDWGHNNNIPIPQ